MTPDLAPSREWLNGLAELDPLPEPTRPHAGPVAEEHWRRLAADSVRAISTERLIELIGVYQPALRAGVRPSIAL